MLLPWVLATALIGLLCFYLGYYASPGTLLARALPRVHDRWHEHRLGVLILGCLGSAAGLLGVLVETSGGLSVYLSRLYDINDLVLGKDYLLLVPSSLIVLALALSYIRFLGRRGTGGRVMLFTVCITVMAISLLLGFRGSIIQFAVSLFIVNYYLGWRQQYRRTSLVALAALLSFALLILPYYSVVRDVKLPSWIGLRERLTIAYELTNYNQVFVLLFQRYYGDESMTAILDKVGRISEPEYGRTLLAVFAEPIPRVIWPEKPLSMGFRFTRFFSSGEYGDRSVASIITLPGEFYWNFMWSGVVLGMIAFGIICRTGDEFLRLNMNRSGVLLYLAAFRYALAINEGSIAGHTISDFIVILIPALACHWFLTFRVFQPGVVLSGISGRRAKRVE